MATFYGNEYGAALGAGAFSGAAPDKANPAILGGKLRILNFSYTLPASSPPATGDNILLGRIPKGARIYWSYFGCEDLSATAATRITLQMGSTAISAAKDPNSAIATAVDLTPITGVGNCNGVAVTSGNEDIKAAVSGTSGALDGTAGGKFWGAVVYAVE